MQKQNLDLWPAGVCGGEGLMLRLDFNVEIGSSSVGLSTVSAGNETAKGESCCETEESFLGGRDAVT
jgi:hypothetical protein